MDALVMYSQSNFKSALNKFQSIQNPSERNTLYQAICYLELNDISKAETILSDLQSNPNKYLAQESQWYLSLVHLKNKNNSFASEILSIIKSDPSHLYYDNATKLYNDIIN